MIKKYLDHNYKAGLYNALLYSARLTQHMSRPNSSSQFNAIADTVSVPFTKLLFWVKNYEIRKI